jgi:uncharacterized protein (TIGR02246 family)
MGVPLSGSKENSMQSDEQQVRQLVTDWMAATRAGDSGKVLDLMTEDVVFLVPGHEPMRKADFAAAQKGQAGMKFDGRSEIQEVKVLGDWAFMWSKLEVVTTIPGGKQMTREGHTLSILRKENGKWRLARDANLLGPPKS